jgi:hypothetical protein
MGLSRTARSSGACRAGLPANSHAPLQSYSIVAPVQEQTCRNRYGIAIRAKELSGKERVMSESKSGPHSSYDAAMLEKRLGPLGLLPSFETSTETKERLEKLERFSLDREMRCLKEDKTFTMDHNVIPTLAREFKRFMSLGLLFPNPTYNFAPSWPVDRMWHELLLDTKRYHTMCMEVHGAFVHHSPLDPERVEKNAGEIMGYTKASLFAAYGAVVPWIWGTHAKCFYTSGCDQLPPA